MDFVVAADDGEELDPEWLLADEVGHAVSPVDELPEWLVIQELPEWLVADEVGHAVSPGDELPE